VPTVSLTLTMILAMAPRTEPRTRHQPQQRRECHNRGFTLLEMMLVIVLVGITSSLVVTRMSPERDPLARAGSILLGTLENALEQASKPRMTITTIISSRVKPRCFACRTEVGMECIFLSIELTNHAVELKDGLQYCQDDEQHDASHAHH